MIHAKFADWWNEHYSDVTQGLTAAHEAYFKGREDVTEELAQAVKDANCLHWMVFHGAKICWHSDDEMCYVQWSDRSGCYRTASVDSSREAIRAAMAGEVYEV